MNMRKIIAVIFAALALIASALGLCSCKSSCECVICKDEHTEAELHKYVVLDKEMLVCDDCCDEFEEHFGHLIGDDHDHAGHNH